MARAVFCDAAPLRKSTGSAAGFCGAPERSWLRGKFLQTLDISAHVFNHDASAIRTAAHFVRSIPNSFAIRRIEGEAATGTSGLGSSAVVSSTDSSSTGAGFAAFGAAAFAGAAAAGWQRPQEQRRNQRAKEFSDRH